MYHDFGLKYHHFGIWGKFSTHFFAIGFAFSYSFLLTSNVALTTLSVRIFSPSVTVVIGEFIRVPDLRAMSAQTMGNECPDYGQWVPRLWASVAHPVDSIRTLGCEPICKGTNVREEKHTFYDRKTEIVILYFKIVIHWWYITRGIWQCITTANVLIIRA